MDNSSSNETVGTISRIILTVAGTPFAACVSIVLVCVGCALERQEVRSRSEDDRAVERRIHELVNAYRVWRGLTPLAWHEVIAYRALLHSQTMASKRVEFSHAGFELRASEIARYLPYRDCAENIGMNWGCRDPAGKFVESWIQSSDHRKNLEGHFDLTGIGIARSNEGAYYATQIFVRTR